VPGIIVLARLGLKNAHFADENRLPGALPGDLEYSICEVCVSGVGPGAGSKGRHPICGALDARGAQIENVRIDHCGGHVPVAEELLDGSDAAVQAYSIRLFAPAITGWRIAPSRDLLKGVAGQLR
jgi:hypothetical protein